MKRIICVLIMTLFVAAPAMADLFTFTYGQLTTDFDTSSGVFTAALTEGETDADVSRLQIANRIDFI